MDGNHGIEANNAVQELVDAGLTIEKATLAVTMSQDSNNHDRNNEVISRMISLMRDADISANDAMIVAAMDLGIEYESTENIIGHMEMSDEMEECFMNNGFTKQESFNALLNTGCGIEESLEMLIYVMYTNLITYWKFPLSVLPFIHSIRVNLFQASMSVITCCHLRQHCLRIGKRTTSTIADEN
eukprot:473834_1